MKKLANVVKVYDKNKDDFFVQAMINPEVKKESKNKNMFSFTDDNNNKKWRKRGRGNKSGLYRQSRGRGKYNRGNRSGFKSNNY